MRAPFFDSDLPPFPVVPGPLVRARAYARRVAVKISPGKSFQSDDAVDAIRIPIALAGR